MGKFEIKKPESKVLETVTFNKKEDYKTVKLNSGKVCLLHTFQANKLVKEKKATFEKDAEILESPGATIRTKVPTTKQK